MWLFDIYHCAYSRDMGRRFSVNEHHKYFGGEGLNPTTFYTVSEEWHTPESQGDTGDWDYYTFMTYQDAAIFVAQLILRLNNPMQNRLMRAAENFVTDITRNYKKIAKQAESNPKPKPAPKTKSTPKPKPATSPNSEIEQRTNMKRVYIFDPGNGTVKIGVSNNVETRRQSVMHSSGLFIRQYCYSDMLPKKEAFAIEQACHLHFAGRKTLGEFFAVSYDEAKAHLQTYTSVIEADRTNY